MNFTISTDGIVRNAQGQLIAIWVQRSDELIIDSRFTKNGHECSTFWGGWTDETVGDFIAKNAKI